MGQGIYINLNDGRPAMEITSGLRIPNVTGSVPTSGFNSANGGLTFGLTQTSGSTAFMLPIKAVDVVVFGVVPEVYYLNGFQRVSDSQGRINVSNFNGARGRLINFSGNCFEIAGAASGQGILVANSTDFVSITTNSRILTAQYVGTVTVNGSYKLPVTGVPFGRWSDPNVTVEFDGDSILCRSNSYTGIDNVGASVTIDLVIFNNTAPVGGPGITIVNPAGQVVFSTVKRPFVLGGFLQLTNSFQSIGGGYFPILRTGAYTRVTGGYNNLRYKGVVMSGGSVRSEFGSVIGNYSTKTGARFPFNTNIAMSLPYLPNMY
ncbi:hypothetical protein CY1_00002 [Escherichia phage CY1_Cui-2023]|nr:hypothetical protein CY1_00002 [Escherichia phage CY1_Cui-2023]